MSEDRAWWEKPWMDSKYYDLSHDEFDRLRADATALQEALERIVEDTAWAGKCIDDARALLERVKR